MKNIRVVICTAPKEEGRRMAKELIKKKLCACVNISECFSTYVWEGKIVEDNEVLMMIKTTGEKTEQLKKEIRKIHPYSVPEMIVINPEETGKEYSEWINAVLK